MIGFDDVANEDSPEDVGEDTNKDEDILPNG